MFINVYRILRKGSLRINCAIKNKSTEQEKNGEGSNEQSRKKMQKTVRRMGNIGE